MFIIILSLDDSTNLLLLLLIKLIGSLQPTKNYLYLLTFFVGSITVHFSCHFTIIFDPKDMLGA